MEEMFERIGAASHLNTRLSQGVLADSNQPHFPGEDSLHYTLGLFKFEVMPFGFHNVPTKYK